MELSALGSRAMNRNNDDKNYDDDYDGDRSLTKWLFEAVAQATLCIILSENIFMSYYVLWRPKERIYCLLINSRIDLIQSTDRVINV